jgi:predicted Zn-dependent protease
MKMRAEIRNNLTKLLMAFLSVALFLVPPPRTFALSIEDERIMGQQFVMQITRHFELLDDDFANGYFNGLGHYLLRSVDTKPFPFRFYMVKHSMLNAFAAPGGHIFFFSGLIEEMESIDELAAVMSHEIGHVTARHLAERIEKAKKMSYATMAGILAGILVGGAAGQTLMAGSSAAQSQAMLHNSRNDERQADQLGFKYTTAAGFDPKGLIVTLEKIQKSSWIGTDQVPSYLLTHPTGPERMSNIEGLLSAYSTVPYRDKASRFNKLFPFFKTVVTAKCLDPGEAERRFMLDLGEAELGDEINSALPHFGLGMIYSETSEPALAIEHLNKALDEEPEFIPIHTHLAEAYQMTGQDKKAIMILEKALKLDDSYRPTLFLLGLSYENLGQYEKALAFFEKLASFRPVKKEVYYHLGISYGRQNRLAYAHYNFGIYFMRSMEREKAQFHFNKADELCGNDPALKKTIRQALQKLG